MKQYVLICDDDDFIDCLGIFRSRARALENAMDILNERYSEKIPSEYHLGCLENTTNENAEMIHVYRKNGSILDTIFIIKHETRADGYTT